tara:strand:+ start:295 stop:804 length:510 start_codon:yes stop_codon:yes gene_type:complete
MAMRGTIIDQTNQLLKPENIYNNPGNIEATQEFAGQIGTYGDGRFAEFDSAEMGMRALAMDLNSKMKQFDGNVFKMIEKYAPFNENKTVRYSNFVTKELGKNKVTFDDMPQLMSAIIKFENTDQTKNYYLNDPKKMQMALALAFNEDGSNRQFDSGISFEQAKKIAGLE